MAAGLRWRVFLPLPSCPTLPLPDLQGLLENFQSVDSVLARIPPLRASLTGTHEYRLLS